MGPFAKSALLFGATGVAIASGHLLRRTLLRESGRALIVLGSIALPIDFLGAVQFKLLPASNAVGLVASGACFPLYVILSRIHKSPAFAWLSVAATASPAAFGLARAGMPWKYVPAWTTPFMVAAVALSSRISESYRMPARFAGLALTYAGGLITLGLHVHGTVHSIVAMEVAFGASVAIAVFVRKPAITALAAVALGGMLWAFLDHFRFGPRIDALACGRFGAVSLLSVRGRRDHALPFTILSVLVSCVAVGLALWHRERTALVLAVLLVLSGMGLRRGILVFGGTGAFTLEVLAKAFRLMIRADLSLAVWGLVLGGFMIALMGIFESRKLQFVRTQAEGIKLQAAKLLARWD